MKRKTFEEMSKGYPQLEELRQLRHARDKMRTVKLAVGADGRNRTVLWPFKAKTVTHTTESLSMDLLTSGVAALADQARAGNGRRLYRLFVDGIHDCGSRCPTDTAARSTTCSTCIVPAIPI